MDSVRAAIRSAVCRQLAEADLCLEFTPEESYADFDMPLTDSDLHVDVAIVTDKQKSELLSRNQRKLTVPIHVLIRKQLTQEQQDDATGKLDVKQVDPLMLLYEQISDFFDLQALKYCEQAVWKGTETVATTATAVLRETKQFRALVQINFEYVQNIVAA